MIVKKHRFHGQKSLKTVYSRGKTIRGNTFNIRYYNKSPNYPYRVAVVVSKKISKSAVVRNKIRRRIYEIVRQNQPKDGLDMIISVYSDQLATIEYAALEQSIKELLNKLN